MNYTLTASEMQSNNIIDRMFTILDADEGGSLDVGEIQALFHKNGIKMSYE